MEQEICKLCKKVLNNYEVTCAAIPPVGLYLSNNEFICDDCLTNYYHANNDLFNMLYQNEERNKDFNENLFSSIRYFLPKIFRLSRKTISKKLRQQILKKYNYTCVKCKSKEKLEIDHIYPYSEGGDESPENLQVLCKTCNLKKSNKI